MNASLAQTKAQAEKFQSNSNQIHWNNERKIGSMHRINYESSGNSCVFIWFSFASSRINYSYKISRFLLGIHYYYCVVPTIWIQIKLFVHYKEMCAKSVDSIGNSKDISSYISLRSRCLRIEHTYGELRQWQKIMNNL